MGLLESASLRVGMPVEVRLSTVGSPQTPRKWDLTLGGGVVVVVVVVSFTASSIFTEYEIEFFCV